MIFARYNPIQELRKLRRSLELVALKIATGATLDSSLRTHTPKLNVPKALALQWIWMRNAIADGQIPAKTGVEAFAELVRTHELCLSQSRKHGLNAKIQSRVLAATSVLAMIASSYFVDAPLWSNSNLLALSLSGIGFALLLKIEKQLTKNLWRLEWMILWFYVRTLIECGMTPAQALSQSLQWCPLSDAVPQTMVTNYQNLLRSLRSGEPHKTLAAQGNKHLDSMDLIIIDQFGNAANDGVQTSLVARKYGEQYGHWLQETLTEKAERSAFLNLIPLYFCFAPAIFWALLGPILGTYLNTVLP